MQSPVKGWEVGSIPTGAANSWPVMRQVSQPLCLRGEIGALPIQVAKRDASYRKALDDLCAVNAATSHHYFARLAQT